MKNLRAATGYSRNGLPYNRLGSGPRTLVVFQGGVFENKPATGLLSQILVNPYNFLGKDFTVYVVLRRPGLPQGYSLKDMADDYAVMVRDELGAPVDVIGMSTGGSIAQHFAADHPELVRRLVLHSSAYTLSKPARDLELRVASLASRRLWRAAYKAQLDPMFTLGGITRYLARPVWPIVIYVTAMLDSPEDPSDLVVTIEAEDKHNFKERLGQITAPTLVAAGDQDGFYSEALFCETAEGLPDARLIFYKGQGHPVYGRRFQRDVLQFLKEIG